MPSKKFVGPIFRLVRTFELQIDRNGRKRSVRAELFQDAEQPTRFRYWLWGVETFKLQPEYHPEPLSHEVLTTFCLPNLGAGDYFEAADVNEAEQKFFGDFRAEFERENA